MKGNFEKTTLWHGNPTTTSNFQLPTTHVSQPNVAPMPRGGGYHRRGFSGSQMAMMLKVYREQVMFAASLGEQEAFGSFLSAMPTGPEWVFHGTTASWDAIYDSGGLQAVGDDTSVASHVYRSSDGSGYVATSRELSVAMSFAKSEYWVYLIYATCGMKAITTAHNQDEVIIPGDVPIRDIFMFKQLDAPRVVYRNLDFSGPVVNATLITRCQRLIGGGVY